MTAVSDINHVVRVEFTGNPLGNSTLGVIRVFYHRKNSRKLERITIGQVVRRGDRLFLLPYQREYELFDGHRFSSIEEIRDVISAHARVMIE